MVYEWKHALSIPAQRAGCELERMERVHGVITPEIVLEESRAEGAVLHQLFEWDDTKAAEKYRVHQAGSIIRNLTVKIEDIENAPITRAFVNVSEERKGQYVTVTNAMSNECTRNMVLERARAELRAFEIKYAELAELADVFAAIHNVA